MKLHIFSDKNVSVTKLKWWKYFALLATKHKVLTSKHTVLVVNTPCWLQCTQCWPKCTSCWPKCTSCWLCMYVFCKTHCVHGNVTALCWLQCTWCQPQHTLLSAYKGQKIYSIPNNFLINFLFGSRIDVEAEIFKISSSPLGYDNIKPL